MSADLASSIVPHLACMALCLLLCRLESGIQKPTGEESKLDIEVIQADGRQLFAK